MFLENPAAIWLILTVAFVIVEVITLGLTTIWFAGGSLAALAVVMLGGEMTLSVIVFLVVSTILVLLVRPIANKRFNKEREHTNADSLIGEIGIVIEGIDNINAKGLVRVKGQEWAARVANEEGVVAAGCKVRIESIEGVKLIVKKYDNTIIR